MRLSRRQLALGGLAFAIAPGGFALAQDDEDDAPENLFISPCGQPFRAKITAPYPVLAWFKQADKNGDGRIDHGEFLADAKTFFGVLDVNHTGVLGAVEVERYEKGIAPEVLGYRVHVSSRGGRLWLAQASGMGPGSDGYGSGHVEGNPQSDSDSNTDDKPRAHGDEPPLGASPFSFFGEPEPVTTADFDFDNRISLANFLRLADQHFTTLDTDGRGYLTLDKLPKTAVQKVVELWQKKHRIKA